MRFVSASLAFLLFAVIVGDAPASAQEAGTPAAGEAFFENKIRPVLVAKCFECHSGDAQEGELRLDRRDLLLRGGRSGRVVLPGDPRGSLLLRLVRRVDRDLKMPPDEADKLTEAEINDFTVWIRMGAPFPGNADASPVKPRVDLPEARKFWSFQPLQAKVPAASGTSKTPPGEIDRFIQARLQATGLKPSPSAEKRTLLRRASYDLTGLPPTLDELQAFLADDSPDAFEKVVDRLLASPQYGVHWGRHWLDVARYGDTRWVGAGEDKRWPFAYSYRDWVIGALNEDLPYDRFVTLQLAADQTPNARPQDLAALGFLTVGRWFTGKMPDVIDDQIDVATRGLLGLSAQCARCHDHKFDPITAQDYYSLYGLFAAARMPVDGSGLIADLPTVEPPPADDVTARRMVELRTQVDDFVNRRIDLLRTEFRSREKLLQYFPTAQTLLTKTDDEVRSFAKQESFDAQQLLRWVRYLKRTTKEHAIFAPWHALASISAKEWKAKAAAVIDAHKTPKLNRHVAEMLDSTPNSFAVLAERYVDLLLRYDDAKPRGDSAEEQLRQVLRGQEGPPQVSLNELNYYLSEAEKAELAVRKKALTAYLASLPESVDLYLSYQRDVAPLRQELHEFLEDRRRDAEASLRSAEKIAACLLLVREMDELSESQFLSTVKAKQLSVPLVERWSDYLRLAAERNDELFGPWFVFAAAADQDFAEDAVAKLTEQAQQATRNKLVLAALALPPTSRAAAAQVFAELIARHAQSEPFTTSDAEAIRRVAADADSPLRFEHRDVVDYLSQKDLDDLKNKERKLLRISVDSIGTPPQAMIMQESARGYAQRVFVRGNPNTPGETAHGGYLSVLCADAPRPFTAGRGRYELAQQIVGERSALAARVIVNRVWQWHFGTGLVPTSSDFGVRGLPPSHPELLDWLAQSLIDDDWSLKKLHRRILLSTTWQQTSADVPKYRELDPENRLLWRGNRHRLGFEELRDSLLAAAGVLDDSLGGRPVDLTKNAVRRRTVFGTVDRVMLPGFYRYFDFPGSDAHTPERQETTVAQQALYLMNSGFVMEQALAAALRSNDAATPAARIDRLYTTILGRLPTDQERELGLAYVQTTIGNKTATVKKPVESSAWQYGTGTYDERRGAVTQFQPFPHFANNQWRGGPAENDPMLGKASLHARGGYAGPSGQLAVIRRWTAPRSGPLKIEGVLSASPTSVLPLGDGVRGRIVSSRRGQLGVWVVLGTEEATNLDIDVEAGETMDFIVDGRGRDQFGTFSWSPVLRLPLCVTTADEPAVTMEQAKWDPVKDFNGKVTEAQSFDVWSRYAQVLLQSNEFLFVD
jgi:mono/diheme cytochrome c family protein